MRRDAGGKGGGETEAVRGRWVVARKDKVVGLGRRRARAPISAAALPTSEIRPTTSRRRGGGR